MRLSLALFAVTISILQVSGAAEIGKSRGKSSILTAYEARFNQFPGTGADPNEGVLAGQHQLEKHANDETWERFAARCAEVIRGIVMALTGAVTSNPGDATDLQLDIKNRIYHHDNRKRVDAIKSGQCFDYDDSDDCTAFPVSGEPTFSAVPVTATTQDFTPGYDVRPTTVAPDYGSPVNTILEKPQDGELHCQNENCDEPNNDLILDLPEEKDVINPFLELPELPPVDFPIGNNIELPELPKNVFNLVEDSEIPLFTTSPVVLPESASQVTETPENSHHLLQSPLTDDVTENPDCDCEETEPTWNTPATHESYQPTENYTPAPQYYGNDHLHPEDVTPVSDASEGHSHHHTPHEHGSDTHPEYDVPVVDTTEEPSYPPLLPVRPLPDPHGSGNDDIPLEYVTPVADTTEEPTYHHAEHGDGHAPHGSHNSGNDGTYPEYVLPVAATTEEPTYPPLLPMSPLPDPYDSGKDEHFIPVGETPEEHNHHHAPHLHGSQDSGNDDTHPGYVIPVADATEEPTYHHAEHGDGHAPHDSHNSGNDDTCLENVITVADSTKEHNHHTPHEHGSDTHPEYDVPVVDTTEEPSYPPLLPVRPLPDPHGSGNDDIPLEYVTPVADSTAEPNYPPIPPAPPLPAINEALPFDHWKPHSYDHEQSVIPENPAAFTSVPISSQVPLDSAMYAEPVDCNDTECTSRHVLPESHEDKEKHHSPEDTIYRPDDDDDRIRPEDVKDDDHSIPSKIHEEQPFFRPLESSPVGHPEMIPVKTVVPMSDPYFPASPQPPLIMPPFQTIPIPSDAIYIPISGEETANIPEGNQDFDGDEDCSCDECYYEDVDHKSFCKTACKDLEQARDELKAIFDKIRKKLRCSHKIASQQS